MGAMVEQLEQRSLLSGEFGYAFAIGSSDDGPGDDRGGAVAALPGGDVVVGFEFRGTVDLDRSAGSFSLTSLSGDRKSAGIARVASDGTVVWGYAFGGSDQDRVDAVRVLEGGEVYITGSFRGTADLDPTGGTQTETSGEGGNRRSGYLIKLNSDGSFAWAQVITGAGNVEIEAMTLDASGNAFVAGKFEGLTDFDPGTGTDSGDGDGTIALPGGDTLEGNAFVVRYDSDGTFAWASTFEGVMVGSDVGFSHAHGVAVGSDGSVVVTGVFSGTVDFNPGAAGFGMVSGGTTANTDIFIVKLDSTGGLTWAKRIGGAGGVLDDSGDEQESGRALGIDDNGNVLVAGRFIGTVDFDPGVNVSNLTADGKSDGFLLKLTTDGDFEWVRRIGGAAGSNGTQWVDSLEIDDSGNAYISGSYDRSFDADPSAAVNTLTNRGGDDGFVMRFSSAGALNWAKSVGGTGDDLVNGISLTADNSVFVAGAFAGTVDFNPGAAVSNITAAGAGDGFVLKLLQTGATFTTVTISSTDTAAGEVPSGGTANGGNFRLTRTGSLDNPLTVTVTRGGTATIGAASGSTGDFWLVAGGTAVVPTATTYVIPAGQATLDIVLNVRDDTTVEAAETATFTVVATAAYGVSTNAAERSVTVTIADDEPTLSIAATDAAGAEVGSGGSANGGAFTITRTGSTANALTVPLTFAGTALRGTGSTGDYSISVSVGSFNATTGVLTIPAGESSVVLTLTVRDDAAVEASEAAIVTLAASSTAAYRLSETLSQRTATVTIADDEPTLSITATDAAAAEVPSGGSSNNGVFTITRSGSTAFDLTVPLSFAGTALRGTGSTGDYSISASGGTFNATTGVLTIPAGSSSVTLTLTVRDDAIVEPAETAIVTLGVSATNAYRLSETLSQRTATVTIADDEPTLSITASDAAAAEVASGGSANNGVFTITRSGSTAFDLTVPLTFAGTALRGTGSTGDYSISASSGTFNATTGVLTIPAGSSSVTLTLTVRDDALVETAETAIVTLGASATGAYRLSETLSQRTATVTIADDEPTITIAATDANAGEVPSGGTANGGEFTVTRTGSSAFDLLVPVTFTGTALRGAGSTGDYSISVTGGTYSTAGVLTIPAGTNSVTFSVTVRDDTVVEAGETVIATVGASATSAYRLSETLSQRTATVTIADDEPTLSITATDANAAEVASGGTANGGALTISRSGSTAAALTIPLTITGTATRGNVGAGDYSISVSVGSYNATTGLLTLPAGEASVVVTITVTDDAAVEPSETAIVTLGASATGAYRLSETLGDRTATVTIADDEPTLSIVATDAAAAEVASGGTANNGVFTITRTGSTANAISVPLAFTGAATRGAVGAGDYSISVSVGTFNATTGLLTIPAGESSVVLTLTVTDDAVVEAAETAVVTLGASATNAYRLSETLSQRTATVTIADDEPTVSITATDEAAAEVGSGTANNGTFTVTRTGSTGNAISIPLAFTGTATRGAVGAGDYSISVSVGTFNATTGLLTIPAGEASVVLTLTVTDDAVVEPAETAIVTLGASATNAYRLSETLSQRTATVGIADDEPTVSVTATDAAAAEVGSGTANNGAFTITRTGSTANALTVPLTFTGSALRGTGSTGDYSISASVGTFNATTGLLSIPAGTSSVVLTVSVRDDALVEPAETAIVTLGASATNTYRLSETLSQRTATVSIEDDEPTVSITATDAAAAEVATGTANNGTFTISRSGSTANAISIPLAITGTATRGTGSIGDYSISASGGTFDAATGVLTMAAGSSSVVLTVSVRDDALVEPTETAIVTLGASATNTYRLSETLSQRTATVSIEDDEPTVSITATDGAAAEVATGTANNGTFTISRSGSTANAISIPLGITGTATRGTGSTGDYFFTVNIGELNLTTGVLTIPADQASVVLTVNVRDDLIVDPSETVIVAVGASTTGSYSLTSTLSARTATVTIADDEPVVSIIVDDEVAGERGSAETQDSATFIISRSGTTTGDLTVSFALAGTATRGEASDYTIRIGDTLITGSTLVIPSGSDSVTVTVTAIDDVIVEPTETIVMTLSASAGNLYALSPNVGDRSASAVLADNEPVVTIEATDFGGAEGDGTDTGTVRISRTGPTDRALTVTFSRGGTATFGGTGSGDYTLAVGDTTLTTTTVDIPAGESFIDVTLNVRQDAVAEPTETAIITLVANATRYSLGDAESRFATVSVVDDEPFVSVSPTATAVSDESAGLVTGLGFVVARRAGSDITSDPVTIGAMTINFTLAGTGTRGSDYTLAVNGTTITGNTVTIPDGESSVEVTVVPVQDTVPEGTETVVFRLAASAAYTADPIDDGGSAIFEIIDDEPSISIRTTAGAGVEANIEETGITPAAFVIERIAADTSEDLLVTFTVTGTATSGLDYTGFGGTSVVIPAGSASVELDLRPFTDGLAEATPESVIITLVAAPSRYTLDADPQLRTATINITDEPASSIADYGIASINPVTTTISLSTGGPAFTLGGVLRNTGALTSGPLTATLFLASTRDAGATRFQVGTGLSVGAIAAGGSLNLSTSINPNDLDPIAGLTPGSYYFVVVLTGTNADGTNVNNEFVSLTNSFTITA